MFAHFRLTIRLDLRQFGFLIGGENLHDLRLNAGVLNLELDHSLRILRGERARLGFVERTTGLQCLHGIVVLAHLLHQRLDGWFLFFKDRLDLGVLIAGQIQLLKHVVEVAVGSAKTVMALRKRGCHCQQYGGADGEMRVRVNFIGTPFGSFQT